MAEQIEITRLESIENLEALIQGDVIELRKDAPYPYGNKETKVMYWGRVGQEYQPKAIFYEVEKGHEILIRSYHIWPGYCKIDNGKLTFREENCFIETKKQEDISQVIKNLLTKTGLL